MEIIKSLITNQALVSAACSWFTAQVLKMLIEMMKGTFSLKRLSGGGGMPSGHSATVTGLLIGTGLASGWNSSAFGTALFFAIIVMYDAMGVRYTTGQQSRILNQLRERDLKEGRTPLFDKPLEEHMGHTLPEIAAGVLVGVVISFITAHIF